MGLKQNNPPRLLKTFLRDISQKNKLNAALEAYLKDIAPLTELTKTSEIPFSSDRKFSAAVYADQTLVLGAPEMLLEKNSPVSQSIEAYTKAAYRVVVFGQVPGQSLTDQTIKAKFIPLAVIALDDPIREETPGTLAQLTKEHIEYRIISGDSPDTVAAIAKKINPTYPASAISGDELEQLQGEAKENAILTHTIFARIKPQQKQLIIKTLKKHKLFTVMIGDGVNDVLALKESDVGVAMNGGSSMAKDVADVVLLNNSFATLPLILFEGRRIITNIQTIANIYLMKNISSIAAILMLGFIGLRFPFDPKHVELASLLIIGIPSFVLAFEKHTFSTTDEGFIKRLLLFSGIVGFGNALVYTLLYTYYDLTSNVLFYSRSVLVSAVIFLGVNNLFLIYLEHYRFAQIIRRKLLMGIVVAVYGLFCLCLLLPGIRTFFEIKPINVVDILIVWGVCMIGSIVIGLELRRFHLLHQE